MPTIPLRPLQPFHPLKTPVGDWADRAAFRHSAILAVEREVGRAFQLWADEVLAQLEPELRVTFRADGLWNIIRGLFIPEPNEDRLRQTLGAQERRGQQALQRVVGVSAAQVLPEAEQLRQQGLREATDLIRGTESFRRRVESLLAESLRKGERVEVVRKKLQREVGIGKRRAELIARDQVLKNYARIQELRQRRLGVRQYVWVTAKDERVRDGHRQLEGTVQSWDAPPIVDPRTGKRAHPGFDFQCRCSARPVVV